MNSREKILTLENLLERAAEARASGRRIILAAGRFDLISPETVKALQSAREGNSLIVVVVAPDSAIGLSLLVAEARAQLAAALASVDFVVIGEAEAIGQVLRPGRRLDVPEDLAPKLIERFRLERRD